MRALSFIVAGLGLMLVLAGCNRTADHAAMSPSPVPAAVPIQAIAGQKWIVDSVRPSIGNDFDWSRRGISLELDPATGRAAGYGGCNRWSAGYSSDAAGDIAFSAAIATRMACMEPAGVMEREQEFLDRLATIASYRLSEDHLYLESDDGAGGIVLIRDDV
jgi:heat shock protein HslJ